MIKSRDAIAAIVSFTLMTAGIMMDAWFHPEWFAGVVRFIWYAVAYLPVALPVLWKGLKLALRGEIFTEFLLMGLATIGAFYLGQYAEGVAVMLFYSVGELLQDAAVHRAKGNIKALLDVRPDKAEVFRNEQYEVVDPLTVQVGDKIRVKVGERIPLDGTLLSDKGSFNAAALTGESKPVTVRNGGQVLAGMINEQSVIELQTTKIFEESSLARILTMVQGAQGRKAKPELLIRRFAKAYTPAVVFVAIAITLLPYFFDQNYHFHEWLYRALIFLVISCPCALVVAIPLGYFGGIGAGSRHGILFKGSTYLDRMTRVDTVVLDKTGTLTKGVFKVQKVVSEGRIDQEQWLSWVAAVEYQSTHPIAKAIVEYTGKNNLLAMNISEITGHGLKGYVEGKEILVGNKRLLEMFGVSVNADADDTTDTVVAVAIEKKLAGYIVISDELKDDSKDAISRLHALQIKTYMLSGDDQKVVDKIAKELNIEQAFGNLLPEDKVAKVESIKKGKQNALAFVGDGINDAPVLAISDVGIAMGGLGSDAAIETADVVIQTDQPSKIATAIAIGKETNAIVWQNIGFAFAVKLIVMVAGAWGVASMWEAVFADVGVALLAILNAVRIQKMKF